MWRYIAEVQESTDTNFDKNLILGDFIHAFWMQTTINADPASLVKKVLRDQYVQYIAMRADINKTFGYDEGEYIKVHKKLLIACRLEKVITRSTIRSKDKEWTTTVYNMLTHEGPMSAVTKKLCANALSDHPYVVLKNKYLVSTFRNVLELRRKKKEMVYYNNTLTGVEIANNIPFKLDRAIYNENKTYIHQNLQKLLENCESSSIEDYFIKLKKIVQDEKYYAYYRNGVRFNFKSKKHWTFQENYQHILNHKLLQHDIFDKIFFLPCFIDNRGRQYYGGALSPTFYNIFRYMYSFAREDTTFKNLETSKFFQKIMKYKELINSQKQDINTYTKIILLIEIGKHYIRTGTCYTPAEDFIKAGLQNVDTTPSGDIGNIIYINKLRYTLKQLQETDTCDYNTIIFKDATASGLQNYGILLGYREDTLKYLNMSDEGWWDTYQYIVDRYITDTKLKKRKYWKKTIMTVVYNATWHTCFLDFLDMLREDSIDYNTLQEHEKNSLKNAHRDFYNKVQNEEFKNLFFKNIKKNIIPFPYTKWQIATEKEYKINFRGHRDKYIEKEYTITEDPDKAKTALWANNLHYRDAELVRTILKDFDVLTIHDCFGVRLSQLHLLIDSVNKYYNNYFSAEYYSPFILK